MRNTFAPAEFAFRDQHSELWTLRRRPLRRLVAALGIGAVTAALLLAPSAAAQSASAAAVVTAVPGAYVALTPVRLIDTRYGTGTTKAQLAAGGTLKVQTAGRAGIPITGVGAVMLTVNVLNAGAAGRLIAYADQTTRPNITSVAFSPGKAATSAVVSRLSSAGLLDMWNSSVRPVDLVIDISGYWTGGAVTAAGGFVPLAPARSLDTRTGIGAGRGAWAGDEYARLSWQVTGRSGVPTGAVAAVMAITTTNVGSSGTLVPFDEDANLNPGFPWYANGLQPDSALPATGMAYTAGVPSAEVFIVPLSATGRAALDKSDSAAGSPVPSVDVLGDVVGYIRGGGATAAGTYQPLPVGQLRQLQIDAGGTVTVQVPVAGSATAFLSVTATGGASAGGLVAYQANAVRPTTRNLNFSAGQQVSTLTAVRVSPSSVVALANLSGSTIAVTIDVLGYARASTTAVHTVWSSGRNDFGTMGVGFTSGGTNVPAPAGIAGIRKVIAGGPSSYAIADDGHLWAWGKNTPDDDLGYGQLGIGNSVDQKSPVRVPVIANVVDVRPGYEFATALLADGSVWSWGSNFTGQLGNGDASILDTTTAHQITGLSHVIAIGDGGTTAVEANGSVWTWGPDDAGGLGCPNDVCFTPVRVPSLNSVVQANAKFALRADGTVVSWNSATTPLLIGNLTQVVSLRGGFALRSDGTVWLVPENGAPASRLPGLTSVTSLGDGSAVKADGSVWTVGSGASTRIPNLPLAANSPPSGTLIVTR